ncbi:kinase-like domain-containing protein [Hygrophoropsis aurantiaca]|uniref:Kinase-like domain-containing protein n=1 Tax=Hygrophoropsis aurantiaca TaxID=72124 RepID=A0ACB8ABN3_9AGAM|nr:kinase-like domain-containing protein [Hygrophoropsis aurantiaca]
MAVPAPERPADFYRLYPDLENTNYYRTGGYHPVHIGDIMHGRYRVVNKLGYGAYSTVWLVRDLRAGRYASLKIIAAEAANSASELDVLRHLKAVQANSPGIPGGEFVVKVFDDFTLDGPNGTHQCVVTEVLGPPLDLEPMEMAHSVYPIDMAQRMVAQIARGVAYLHRIGIVHGDLHPGNVLLYAPEIETWSDQDVQKYFRTPFRAQTRPNERYAQSPIDDPHVPSYQVPPRVSGKLLRLCFAAAHVKICDFGDSFLWAGEPRQVKLHTPAEYAAPEIIFRDPVTPAIDIWAMAILAHCLLSGGITLFETRDRLKKEAVKAMVLTLGKLPDKWWSRWGDRAEYFEDSGARVTEDLAKDSEGMARRRTVLCMIFGVMGREEVARFEGLLRRMLRYESGDRLSAEGVVRSLPANWMGGGE